MRHGRDSRGPLVNRRRRVPGGKKERALREHSSCSQVKGDARSQTYAKRTRMPLLMFRVRSGHSARAGSMKSDRAVAFLASPNHVAQPESLFDRNHKPASRAFTGCLVLVPLPDLAFVDMVTGHAPSRSSCGFRAHRGGTEIGQMDSFAADCTPSNCLGFY